MPGPRLRVTLFGSPIVTYDGERVRLPSQKGLAMLLYLAVESRPVPRHELAELLWGEGRLENLRQELSKLRRLPGAERWIDATNVVEVRADTDVAGFERAVGTRDYESALAAAQAEFLRGFHVPRARPFNEWVDSQRDRLSALMGTAQKGRAEALVHAGRIAEAIEHLHRAIELDPLDESAHRTVMRLQFTRGHLRAALEQYEVIRRSLRRELGLTPIAATQELANLIQHGHATAARPERPTRIPPRLIRPIALVGRDREWERLERAWRDKKAAIITGPPGIGKTRLMLDFARSRGRYLLNEGHVTDSAFPLSTLARGLRRARQQLASLHLDPQILRALARLAPDVVPERAGSDPEDGSMELEDAWYLFLLELRPSIDSLAADDIHWFDTDSAHIAESVNVRLSRDDPPSWRHVATLRPEEADPEILDRITHGATIGINDVIELRPFDVEDVHNLLATLEVPGAEALADQLHRYAGGNPMFTLETLRTMYATGRLEPEATTFEMPGQVATTMARRLDALDPASLRTLRAVAVTHPNATPEVLAAMLSETPLAVAEAMGELERNQWLHESAFLHDLGYEAVVRHMPDTVRAFLHRQAAVALAEMGADPMRIRFHREAGGSAGDLDGVDTGRHHVGSDPAAGESS